MAQPYGTCPGSRIPRPVNPCPRRERSRIPKRTTNLQTRETSAYRRTYASPARSAVSGGTYIISQGPPPARLAASGGTYTVKPPRRAPPRHEDFLFPDPETSNVLYIPPPPQSVRDDRTYIIAGVPDEEEDDDYYELLEEPRRFIQELEHYEPYWNEASLQAWVNSIPTEQPSRIARPIGSIFTVRNKEDFAAAVTQLLQYYRSQ